MESQRLAKIQALEKQAKRKKIALADLCVFTQQLGSMLDAGLPLVAALDSLMEQVQDPVFKIIVRDMRADIAGGTSFSEAARKYPNCFPNLFVSMVEAGEASGALAPILKKVGSYFESSVKLARQVKGAMTYPAAVMSLAVMIVWAILVFVIPTFAEFFKSFGKELPFMTQLLIDFSAFIARWWWALLIGTYVGIRVIKAFVATPRGREVKDKFLFKLPVIGNMTQKVALSRFCRTYAILMRSGVEILRSLDIVSNASGNTFIEKAVKDFKRHISQGGMLSEIVAEHSYFPPLVKNMVKAGEQTGNVDGMLDKIADFYDDEVEVLVGALTKLMEPILIVFLGSVIGAMVMAIFLPIFNLSGAVK